MRATQSPRPVAGIHLAVLAQHLTWPLGSHPRLRMSLGPQRGRKSIGLHVLAFRPRRIIT
jgi:hypothetical protein